MTKTLPEDSSRPCLSPLRYLCCWVLVLASLFSSNLIAAPLKKRGQETRAAAARGTRATAKSVTTTVTPEAPTRTIMRIDIEGNRKIEKDAIMARLKSQVKGPFTDALIKEDVVQLFKAGYFYDVQVFREINGNEVNLLYRVSEKPSIGEIAIEGNSELKTEELTEASGLKNYEILDNSKIRDAVEKLQKLYEDKGFFLAKIEPKVEDIKKDESVKVTFNIKENDKVKVKKVTFLGNRRIKDGTLKDRMFTKEGGYFSFLSGSGSYKQDAFDRDMQILRFLYFNEGYVQVKIDRPQVYVTPDRKTI